MAETSSFTLTLQNIEPQLREINNPYQLGLHLGIPSADLKRFEKEHPNDIIRQTIEVIEYWLQNHGDKATWEALAKAVDKVPGGHTNVATRLRNFAKGAASLESTEGEAQKRSENQESESESKSKENIDGEPECKKEEEGIYQYSLSESTIETDTKAKNELPSEEELEHDTLKVMKYAFSTLMTAVRLSLEKRKVSVESLLGHLRTIEAIGPSFKPVYVGHSQPLKTVVACEFQSLVEVFDALTPYCSWFNHLMIENITETFCEGDEDVERRWMRFQEKVRRYCVRRVIDCPEDQYGEDNTTDRKSMVMKVDCNWDKIKVSQLFDIRDTAAKILKIKRCNLYLRTVRNGCVKLHFYVPTYIKISDPQSLKGELQKVGILNLFYDPEPAPLTPAIDPKPSVRLRKHSPVARSVTTQDKVATRVRTIHHLYAWRRIFRYLARIDPRQYNRYDMGRWLDLIDDFAQTMPRQVWRSLRRRLGYEDELVMDIYFSAEPPSFGFISILIASWAPLIIRLLLESFWIPRPIAFVASILFTGVLLFGNAHIRQQHGDDFLIMFISTIMFVSAIIIHFILCVCME